MITALPWWCTEGRTGMVGQGSEVRGQTLGSVSLTKVDAFRNLSSSYSQQHCATPVITSLGQEGVRG